MMEKNLLYIQGQSCGGDTISLLSAEEPDFLTSLKMMQINILWHPSLSTTDGDEVERIFNEVIEGRRPLDIFVVEGSIPTAPLGTGDIYRVLGRPMIEIVKALAAVAEYTIAVGTCASTGGIPASGANPTMATGLQFHNRDKEGVLGEDYRSRSGMPVINIPGCPPHPDWIIGTLYFIVEGILKEEDLDYANRPSVFYNSLAHHGCPRNEFYEFKSSAEEFGQLGCLFEFLGCRGTQCESDCNNRLWLGRTGSCTRGGFPCIACTDQSFPQQNSRFFSTEMIGNIPKYLPKDVPKAWYIGIAGLSKMATPERLKINSISPYPRKKGADSG